MFTHVIPFRVPRKMRLLMDEYLRRRGGLPVGEATRRLWLEALLREGLITEKEAKEWQGWRKE